MDTYFKEGISADEVGRLDEAIEILRHALENVRLNELLGLKSWVMLHLGNALMEHPLEAERLSDRSQLISFVTVLRASGMRKLDPRSERKKLFTTHLG